MTEFTAFGTAIRIPDWPKGEPPFTSSLNGQEFWQLYQSGYLPKSVVMGACAYYMHMDSLTRDRVFGWFSPNQEIGVFTDGYRQSARLANVRMKTELALLKANGAVGVIIDPGMESIEYELNDTKYVDMLLNYVILGTAVVAHPERQQKHVPPLVCLDLASRSYKSLGSTGDYEGNYWEMAGQNLIDEIDDDEE